VNICQRNRRRRKGAQPLANYGFPVAFPGGDDTSSSKLFAKPPSHWSTRQVCDIIFWLKACDPHDAQGYVRPGTIAWAQAVREQEAEAARKREARRQQKAARAAAAAAASAPEEAPSDDEHEVVI
jgi:hypothetical protein